jgi:hypothetical protein
LENLIREIEDVEASYLAPATQKLREERLAVDAQNRSFEQLLLRKAALVSRLRDFLADVHAERRAIEVDLAAVQAGMHGSPDG